MTEFSTVIRESREKKGLRPIDVANGTYCNVSMIKAYERGLGFPSDDTLSRLAPVLGFDYMVLRDIRDKSKKKCKGIEPFVYLCGECPNWQKDKNRTIRNQGLPVLMGTCSKHSMRCERCDISKCRRTAC